MKQELYFPCDRLIEEFKNKYTSEEWDNVPDSVKQAMAIMATLYISLKEDEN